MLRADIIWPEDRQFRSNSEWEPIGFFSESLCNATSFDLMLGFFSSSAINLLSNSFATFLYNGGHMRMIINNILSEEDKKVLMVGESNFDVPFFDLEKLDDISKTLSKRDQHFFDCLAWLIRKNRIVIKIIAPQNGVGIAHYKSGAFSDGKNKVGFNGSCNFSRMALLENMENVIAYCDWDSDLEKCRVNNITKDFEKIFSGNDQSVKYIKANHIITNIINIFPEKDINDILLDERRLIKDGLVHTSSDTIKKILERAKMKVDSIVKTTMPHEFNDDSDIGPAFPYSSGPRDYQQEAFDKWRNNKQQGLFAMATGTGKTITSLNCLFEIYNKCGYYKALILVPTITLVDQWENECKKFNFNKITKVCSKATKWKEEIDNILLQEKVLSFKRISYVVIATYASFAKSNIFFKLNKLSPKTLLIADECHNMGSNSLLALLDEVSFRRRIGLSATPKRQFDDKGNIKLSSFFGSENGYTFEVSMAEAINKGVLCRYYYYPHLVSLTDDEMNEYMKLSNKISKFYNSSSDSFKKNKILTALLLARKRIIHKAAKKLSVFKNIMNDYYVKNGLKYTLVYVPEGNEPNEYFENDFYSANDEILSDEESQHLIDVYTKAVRDIDKKITVTQFVSGIDERDKILIKFANGEINVLTSMKCLDEGVDVPRAELAIFCASTGNARQFVQRRGRILRTHTEKSFAYIHDLVVIPKVTINSKSYDMERNMLKKELERVRDFAELAENNAETFDVLLDIMNYYNLNLYDND